jgi:hypothetical protein
MAVLHMRKDTQGRIKKPRRKRRGFSVIRHTSTVYTFTTFTKSFT